MIPLSGIDADEVMVMGNGNIWVAPAGTSLPTTLAALTDPWVDLGYATEDGVTETTGREVSDLGAWQSFFPIRRLVTSMNIGVSFTLRQTNPDNFLAAYGGGTFTAGVSVGKFEYPDPQDIDIVVLVIDGFDGDFQERTVYPRMQVSGDTTRQLQRGDSANLACDFAALAEDSTNPYVLNNLDAFLT